MRILFVTWDGPQVDYMESLFLPIFRRLQDHGVGFDILQFRWGDAEQGRRLRAACEAAGIGYRAVPVWRRLGGAGALLTALAGRRHVKAAVRQFGSDAIMPRSLMPALAVLAAGGRRLRPIIFDSDGLAADERVDFAGDSPAGMSYRALRAIETRVIRQAAAVLVRTPTAAAILSDRTGVPADRFHRVANGRDEALFHPGSEHDRASIRDQLGVAGDTPLIVYAGSIGPKYRIDLVRAFAQAVARRRPDARLVVLTGSPDLAHAALGDDPPLSPIVRRIAARDMARHLAAADLGLAFITATFSMQAAAPIKLAEYLMCGLPVLGTSAVGATATAVQAGLYLDEGVGMDAAAAWWIDTVLPDRHRYRREAHAIGEAEFSLTRAVRDYHHAIDAAGIVTQSG